MLVLCFFDASLGGNADEGELPVCLVTQACRGRGFGPIESALTRVGSRLLVIC